jgi:hypothetical protein
MLIMLFGIVKYVSLRSKNSEKSTFFWQFGEKWLHLSP